MKAFEIGGAALKPGSSETIDLEVSVLANSTRFDLPVHVMHGLKPGPCFFMSAAVHGDEIQGVEIVRRVLAALRGRALAGTVLAVPIVNSFGFLTHSRYMPDRRDLNRSFPGSDGGSLASLLADLFFTQVVARSQYGVDYHTAALHRTNLPQIRVAPDDKELLRLADAFGPRVVLSSKLREGSLRQAAAKAGVKLLLYEGGEALRFDEVAIDAAVQGTLRFLKHIGMIEEAIPVPPHMLPVHASASSWLRAPEGGILHSLRRPGDRVGDGEELGVITGPLGQNPVSVVAEGGGIIIGRTHLPIVNRGDALFHLARLKSKTRAEQAVPDEDEII
ncbi:MAG: succinylglutamate desuccinylase/aspartoacylase family protein [Alphaproteobacteria bacterium]|nr:succinylglutamate desuccinylase/aspartoacylase family protein [Alphaproteobacteria bacterium]